MMMEQPAGRYRWATGGSRFNSNRATRGNGYAGISHIEITCPVVGAVHLAGHAGDGDAVAIGERAAGSEQHLQRRPVLPRPGMDRFRACLVVHGLAGLTIAAARLGTGAGDAEFAAEILRLRKHAGTGLPGKSDFGRQPARIAARLCRRSRKGAAAPTSCATTSAKCATRARCANPGSA